MIGRKTDETAQPLRFWEETARQDPLNLRCNITVGGRRSAPASGQQTPRWNQQGDQWIVFCHAEFPSQTKQHLTWVVQAPSRD